MKRKIAFMTAILLFAVGILFVSVERSTYRVKQSFAAASLKFEVLSEEISTVSSQPKADYYLVYPGILPDHPLYKIKMIRDRIWLWLTTDVSKRAEIMLLYADKRLGAGKVLIEGNKVSLGVTTLWKAEKYLDKAADTALLAKQKGLEVGKLMEKLNKSSLKHQEILVELSEKVDGEGKTAIEGITKLLQEVQRKIKF